MIDKTDILQTIKRLDQEYNNHIEDPDLPIFYSKLAVLEFSGWIEQSFDTIMYEYLDLHIVNEDSKNIFKSFIKGNYGFRYETNIYKTFSIVLGANNWENILDSIPFSDIQNFKDILHQYCRIRNSAAHTSIKGSTATYIAPSQVIVDFNRFLPAISIIEDKTQKLPLG